MATRSLSVRAKLVGLAVGTAVLALLLACAAFVYYDRVSYAEAKHRTLAVLADSVSQSAFGPTAFQDADSALVILKVLEAEPTAQAGTIYDRDGKQLASWRRPGARVTLPESLIGAGAPEGFSGDKLFVTRKIANPEQSAGTLRVAFSTSDMRQRTQRFLQIAAAVLCVSALLALMLSLLAQRLITRPVGILSAAARRVQEQQDFDVRAERVSADELGQLTDAFNAMLTMIQTRDRELDQHRQNLEHLVAERTRDLDQRNQEMRLVLDNVEQGLVILDHDGRLGPERSAALANWFGPSVQGATLGAYLGKQADGFSERMALGWDQLREALLPLELNIAQLPAAFESGAGRSYEIAYQPIGQNGERYEKMLVIISDVTARVEKERSDAEQAQVIAMFEHVSQDRSGFLDFFEETEGLLERLGAGTTRDRATELREVHTLKGNFGLFGLSLLARLVHRIEDECQASGGSLTTEQRAELCSSWSRIAARARTLLGDGALSMTVGRREVEGLLSAIKAGKSTDELLYLTTRLLLDPVRPKLERIGERAAGLAERLGKAPVQIVVTAEDVRAPGDIGWLWHVLPHVVANSVDHGLDTAEERASSGKHGPATLHLRAIERDRQLVIQVEDDGRGIDWAAVRAKAATLGFPAATDEELQRALFADGVTTKDHATAVSGRGVGLAAVAAACDAHGCKVRVSTDRGRGTLFEFTLEQTMSARRSVPPPGRGLLLQ